MIEFLGYLAKYHNAAATRKATKVCFVLELDSQVGLVESSTGSKLTIKAKMSLDFLDHIAYYRRTCRSAIIFLHVCLCEI